VALAFVVRYYGAPAVTLLAGATGFSLVVVNPFVATREPAGAPNFVETYRHNSPVAKLKEVASFVRSTTAEDGLLITLETPIAVESQRRLWPGLGVTSWGVLDLPDEVAQAMRMTTPNLLAQGVESCLHNNRVVVGTNRGVLLVEPRDLTHAIRS
jgi:hypothetical protein